MKSILILFVCIIFANNSKAQISLNGPEGCDATYFFAAKNGYWLGTGSSGGIFFSNDLNGQWKCMNNPFGPAHIYWIGQVDEKIITNADEKYYEFESKNSIWNLVIDSSKIRAYYLEEATKKKTEIQLVKKIFQNSLILNLPYDVNTIHTYNADSVIVCTQSGLYLLNVTTLKLQRLNTVGVIASDVYQISKNEGLGLIALTQDNCIWGYNKSQWQKLFDYKETEHYRKKFIVPINLDTARNNEIKVAKISAFYPKGYFSVSSNGFILLTSYNSLFVINPSNKQYKIINTLSIHNISEAKIDIDGNIIAVGDYSYNGKNKFMYNQFSFKNSRWNIENSIIKDSIALPILNDDFRSNATSWQSVSYSKEMSSNKKNYSFLFPMSNPLVKMGNETIYFPKLNLFNYAGYFFYNKINSKIISGYYDSFTNELYLGTYGSGVIMIKN